MNVHLYTDPDDCSITTRVCQNCKHLADCLMVQQGKRMRRSVIDRVRCETGRDATDHGPHEY